MQQIEDGYGVIEKTNALHGIVWVPLEYRALMLKAITKLNSACFQMILEKP